MIDATTFKRPHLLTQHSPAIYRIRVRGSLEPCETEHLHGLTISRVNHAGGPGETTLHGKFVDQAALLGVLNHLLGLDVTLLSVEHVATE